jgi:hypothetical protein
VRVVQLHREPLGEALDRLALDVEQAQPFADLRLVVGVEDLRGPVRVGSRFWDIQPFGCSLMLASSAILGSLNAQPLTQLKRTVRAWG